MRQEAGKLHMPACLCCSGLFRPCHALSACLCLDPMPVSPWLHLPLCPSNTMCTRIIAQVAGTALQAVPPTIVFACVSAHSVFCRDCPAGSRTRGLHWCRPCTICVCLRHPVHFSEEPGTALGSRLPPCACVHCSTAFISRRRPGTALGSLAPCFENGMWHAGLG